MTAESRMDYLIAAPMSTLNHLLEFRRNSGLMVLEE
jgi:hypothetical protein